MPDYNNILGILSWRPSETVRNGVISVVALENYIRCFSVCRENCTTVTLFKAILGEVLRERS